MHLSPMDPLIKKARSLSCPAVNSPERSSFETATATPEKLVTATTRFDFNAAEEAVDARDQKEDAESNSEGPLAATSSSLDQPEPEDRPAPGEGARNEETS